MSEDKGFYDPKMQGQPPPYSATPQQPSHPAPVTVMHAPGPVHMVPAVVPVIVGQQMGPNPAVMTCVSCRAEILTKIRTKPTLRTHLFAALLCLIGCWPCMFVPYCVDSCNNSDHYCPNCNAYIGSYIS